MLECLPLVAPMLLQFDCDSLAYPIHELSESEKFSSVFSTIHGSIKCPRVGTIKWPWVGTTKRCLGSGSIKWPKRPGYASSDNLFLSN